MVIFHGCVSHNQMVAVDFAGGHHRTVFQKISTETHLQKSSAFRCVINVISWCDTVCTLFHIISLFIYTHTYIRVYIYICLCVYVEYPSYCPILTGNVPFSADGGVGLGHRLEIGQDDSG